MNEGHEMSQLIPVVRVALGASGVEAETGRLIRAREGEA
jgi:hypothetical protein